MKSRSIKIVFLLVIFASMLVTANYCHKFSLTADDITVTASLIAVAVGLYRLLFDRK